MLQRFPVSWLRALPALAVLTAAAQVDTTPVSPTPPTKTVVAIPAAAPIPYRSVFEGYQPFTLDKVLPWKDTNQTVETIGGWRAYAKEAAEPAAKDLRTPATPSVNPHAGHGKP